MIDSANTASTAVVAICALGWTGLVQDEADFRALEARYSMKLMQKME